jgi:two-component system NarL family sensor kinase
MFRNDQATGDAALLRQRNRELTILNVVAQALNEETETQRALQVVLERVAQLLNLATGWIWLLHSRTGNPYLAASLQLPPALVHTPARMEGSCYCLDTFRVGDLDGAANINVVTCSRLKGLVDGTDGLRYHASIPLYAHGRQLGVLNVASGQWRELGEDDLRILHTIGDLLSIALERARLFDERGALGALAERNRLAREIHDTLAQGLAAITLQLETADALLDANGAPDRVQRNIQQALTLARTNLEEARRSVLDLRAEPLEGRTLAQAITALAQEQAAVAGLVLRTEIVGADQPLPVRVEAGLYRVAQEAITNVVQHAQATTLMVEFVATPQRVQLNLEDDGRGFDPQQHAAARYGLRGMLERVKLLGGQLNIDSSPGAGTQIDVLVPLEQA